MGAARPPTHLILFTLAAHARRPGSRRAAMSWDSPKGAVRGPPRQAHPHGKPGHPTRRSR
eukprot:1882172-Lingulodinium_polyedra.AAC.1